MYQVLYRKWRPTSFDEVVGQDHITATLKNEIAAGRPSHAYLLMGSRGTGKTTCAKLIAKAVNCLDPKDGNPCGQCEICRGIDSGSVVDVVEIDAASNTGVDNIRELRDEARFLPNLAKYRVYIIDEAHMLSAGAVNALLKILEEPPAHVIFILATTEINKIPATIQSRCQRFDFRRIDGDVIARRLGHICAEEGIEASADALELIARLSDGGMRDAFSLLDLCRSHSGAITAATVSEAAGLVGTDYLFDIADAAADGDISAAMELVEKVSRTVEYDRLCGQLIGHYRNLLMTLVSREPAKLIVCLPETLERYRAQSSRYTVNGISAAMRTLRDAQSAMSRTVSRRAELEVAIMRLCDRTLSPSPEALLGRIEELEATVRRLGAVPPPALSTRDGNDGNRSEPAYGDGRGDREKAAEPETAGEAAGEGPEAEPPESASPDEPSAEGLMPQEQWKQVLGRLETLNGMLAGALEGSRAHVDGGRLLVECQNPIFRELMRTNDYTRRSLKDAIAEVTGVRYGIGPYSPPENARRDAAEDPLETLLSSAAEEGVDIRME